MSFPDFNYMQFQAYVQANSGILKTSSDNTVPTSVFWM